MTRVLYDTTVFLHGLLNPHDMFPKLFDLPSDIKLVLSDVVAEEIFMVILRSEHLHRVLPGLQAIWCGGNSQAGGKNRCGRYRKGACKDACEIPHESSPLAQSVLTPPACARSWALVAVRTISDCL